MNNNFCIGMLLEDVICAPAKNFGRRRSLLQECFSLCTLLPETKSSHGVVGPTFWGGSVNYIDRISLENTFFLQFFLPVEGEEILKLLLPCLLVLSRREKRSKG